MSVKFEVKMTDKIMYDFLLYHTYTHVSGLLGAVIGVISLGMGMKYMITGNAVSAMPAFLFAILFLIVTPVSLKGRAKTQVQKTKMFQKPLEYEMTEEGITVRQEELEVKNKWEDFSKAVSTNRAVILYVTRMRAFIFPKESMGEQYEAAVKMISTHMPPKNVKIRHIAG